jgi:hypothetical protein
MTAAAHEGPSYSDLRKMFSQVMLDRGEWAGVPMPVDGMRLHLEPKYPYQELATLLDPEKEADEGGLGPGESLVNEWYSRVRQAYVFIVRGADGRTQHYVLPDHKHTRRVDIALMSIQATWAHDFETEAVAMMSLGEQLTTEQLRQYLLLGQFLERSKRSGVSYVFRRARPTIAMKSNLTGDHMRVLAVLCMHPIGYYHGTTIGAMTPTDDVLAHLMLMRGDEAMYWRRCNQHRPDEPEAML